MSVLYGSVGAAADPGAARSEWRSVISMWTALVLDGGSGQALATARSLGRAGWRVIAPSGTRSAASRYVSRSIQIPEADERPEAFVDAVRAVVEVERPHVVVPCTDACAEVLWAHVEILADARILGGDRRSFDIASDKARALAVANELGFGTPEWLVPETVEAALDALPRVGLPCVVKPRRSYRYEDGHLVHRRHLFAHSEHHLLLPLPPRPEPDTAFPALPHYA